MRSKVRAYSHQGHGPRADQQAGYISATSDSTPHLRTAAGPYIRVDSGSSIVAPRTAGYGAPFSFPCVPPKVAYPSDSGRSALAAGTGLHAPEATFMVAGVNRRAGSTGDSGTAVRSGKAARALPVGFPSDNRAVPLGVISPRFPHFDGHQREPQRPGPRLPAPTPITKPARGPAFLWVSRRRR